MCGLHFDHFVADCLGLKICERVRQTIEWCILLQSCQKTLSVLLRLSYAVSRSLVLCLGFHFDKCFVTVWGTTTTRVSAKVSATFSFFTLKSVRINLLICISFSVVLIASASAFAFTSAFLRLVSRTQHLLAFLGLHFKHSFDYFLGLLICYCVNLGLDQLFRSLKLASICLPSSPSCVCD